MLPLREDDDERTVKIELLSQLWIFCGKSAMQLLLFISFHHQFIAVLAKSSPRANAWLCLYSTDWFLQSKLWKYPNKSRSRQCKLLASLEQMPPACLLVHNNSANLQICVLQYLLCKSQSHCSVGCLLHQIHCSWKLINSRAQCIGKLYKINEIIFWHHLNHNLLYQPPWRVKCFKQKHTMTLAAHFTESVLKRGITKETIAASSLIYFVPSTYWESHPDFWERWSIPCCLLVKSQWQQS